MEKRGIPSHHFESISDRLDRLNDRLEEMQLLIRAINGDPEARAWIKSQPFFWQKVAELKKRSGSE